MRIGFVGAGKVGCSLGRYLAQEHDLIGYASKSYPSAQTAAELTGSKAFDNAADLFRECDALFITTPDGQIVPTWNELKSDEAIPLEGKLICHCSGALPSTELTECHDKGAFAYSVHPLFAISSKTVPIEELQKAFFAIEGDEEKIDVALSLIKPLGNPYQVIDTKEKARYHAAAAMASNHVVALYRIACDELVRCGFEPKSAEKALAPLFLGNAKHIAEEGTVNALTGPAERGDTATIEKHLACLDGETREIYRLLNNMLLQIAAEKHGRLK